jgi:uncharacterized membrane protein YphA (DoxX/SURF4 family)
MATERTAPPAPGTDGARRTDPAGAEPARRPRNGGLTAVLHRRPISLYAASVLRIGYGLCYLAFLLRELPHREQIWGPDSPWTPALADELFRQTGWFSPLTLSDSKVYFNTCYGLALVICALVVLGWRTRVMSVLFALVVVSFHARAIFMTDGGDNLILLMALYLTCTAGGRRWSLDARRTARLAAAGRPGRWTMWRVTSDVWSQFDLARQSLVTALHNCAMFVVAAQVCLLYGSAGLYKVQGASWQSGTALHYVVNLDLFRPWPALSVLADSHPLFIAAASYLTVLIQVAFPFALFSRLKYVVLAMLLGMHLGIALLMGLPLFSAAMIVADAAFLPDRFYQAAGRRCRGAVARLRRRVPAVDPPRTALVPPQAGNADLATRH